MICEVYGYTPNDVGNLTMSQFDYLRDYAYRARFENLLGFHNFSDKSNKWTPPGIQKRNKLSEFDLKIKELKRIKGKSTLSASDLTGIKL